MTCSSLYLALLAMGAAATMWAQAQGPAFEAASIRLTQLGQTANGSVLGIAIDPDRVRIRAMPLFKLIEAAYNIKSYQLDGPDWVVDPDIPTLFDIEAKLPPGATVDQVPLMLQELLKDRFRLAIRKGSKLIDSYALLVGKNGPGFKERDASNRTGVDAAGPALAATEGKNGETTLVRNGTKITITPGRGERVETSTITGIADWLATRLQTPVIDKTGLTGEYDIKMEVPAGNLPPREPGAALDLKALEEEGRSRALAAVEGLGLKLERQRNPVETIIVEHVEKTPTGN